MTPEEREHMNSLCFRIQEEKDYRRFEGLLRELNELIGRKEFRFLQSDGIPVSKQKRPWKKLSGVVQKIFKNVYQSHEGSVEIAIAEAEHLYGEVRIENTFTGADGQPVELKQGAHVDVTFEAAAEDTISKQTDGQAA